MRTSVTERSRHRHREPTTIIGRRSCLLAALIIASAVCTAAPAAAIDLTGAYLVQITGDGYCQVTVTQLGTDFSMAGTCDSVGTVAVAGTVDVEMVRTDSPRRWINLGAHGRRFIKEQGLSALKLGS